MKIITKNIETEGIISLSEIFANPIGSDSEFEFIELYNSESFDISLKNWVLSDASKSYIIPDTVIQAKSYLVFERNQTSIALNNSSEEIYLYNANQELISSYSYESITEGLSLNYDFELSEWYEAEPSKQLSNNPKIIVSPDQNTNTSDQTEKELLDENLQYITLSEFIPNPKGSDENEWIELFNPTEFSISLKGLILTDETNEYIFNDNQIILPQNYYLIYKEESKINLNNNFDSLILKTDEIIIDSITYSEIKEGNSYAKFDTSWKETTQITPKEKNIYQNDQVETSKTNEKEEAEDRKFTYKKHPTKNGTQ